MLLQVASGQAVSNGLLACLDSGNGADRLSVCTCMSGVKIGANKLARALVVAVSMGVADLISDGCKVECG